MRELAYMFFNGKLDDNLEFYKNMLKENKGDIYCADGGANFADQLDLTPLEIWGDLDSIKEDVLDKYDKKNVKIERFPRDKDYSDSELLLEHLTQLNYKKIVGIAAFGGDIDHQLFNIDLVYKFHNLSLISPKEKLFFVKEDTVIENEKGNILSLIPFTEEVKGLTLRGFKYSIEDRDLRLGDTLCMSNIVDSDNAFISLKKGCLVCIIKKI